MSLPLLEGGRDRVFWCTDSLFAVSERGGSRVWEREEAAVPAAGHSALGSWRTGREVLRLWWWFPLPSADHPEQGRKGVPVGENRKPCEISMCASTGAVPVHTCPHLPSEPAQLPDIYLSLCCRRALQASLGPNCTS